MINQQAVKNFLKRPLLSYEWIKSCSLEELSEAISSLRPKPNWGHVKPWLHQLACFLIMLEMKRFMLNVDMGGGKTLLTLMLIKYLKQSGQKPKAIIFVPYVTSVDTWVNDAAKHTPDLKCVALIGSTAQNKAALRQPADLFVICYQSAVWMLSEKVRSVKRGRNKLKLEASKTREVFSGFNVLVMDEIHKCSSATSLTYYMCRALSAQCEWVYGLTGTPFGKYIEALWPQFYLIDFGETLGDTLGFFKGVFFKQGYNYWGGYDFKFKKKLEPQLKRMIKHSSIYYSIDELVDMPEKIYVPPIMLRAPEDSKAYCAAALKDMKMARKNQSLREVESSYLRLRQLSSGYMTFKGEDKERVEVQFKDNPKLEALIDLIESMPYGRKMVVFHHFTYTNQLISNRLKEMKIGHARIWGGQRDPLGQLKRFRESEDCHVLILNDKMGSSSLNLQCANYVVFFEEPDNPVDRQQGERRCWRPGQERRVMIYTLLVKETKDGALYHSNRQGKDFMLSIMQGKTTL